MDKEQVFAALKGGVENKTRRLGLTKYKFCFVAKEAVSFLVSSGIAQSRSEAVRICNVFQNDGLLEHVSKNVAFEDENLYFKFCIKLKQKTAEEILDKVMPSVEVKKRKYRLSTYRNCFVGSELVDQLIVTGITKDRHQANQIGCALAKMGYVERVTGEHDFVDDNYFFRFCRRKETIEPQAESTPATKENRDVPRTFDTVYKRGDKLGEGAFSVVIEAKKRTAPTQSFAIKVVTKSRLSVEDEQALKDEIGVLRELDHDHIIRLFEVFDEPKHYYLVTEHMKGGELFDRIVQKAYYNEKEARDVCKILFQSLDYCHKKNIAHRDLKPENLLLMSNENDRQLKIADFGFAKKAPVPKCLTTQCGTPGYVAPEVLEGVKYGTQADMWSLGVITYILLGGYPPFMEDTQRALFRMIKRGDYQFHPQYWQNVSRGAKGLIKKLLTVNPDERISASQALNDDWILEDDENLANLDLKSTATELQKFQLKKKFKGAVNALIMMNKMESLGAEFHKDLN